MALEALGTAPFLLFVFHPGEVDKIVGQGAPPAHARLFQLWTFLILPVPHLQMPNPFHHRSMDEVEDVSGYITRHLKLYFHNLEAGKSSKCHFITLTPKKKA